jgi:hypothetical protein
MEDDTKILYLQEDRFPVAEIPETPGCYALKEGPSVLRMMEDEYREKGQKLPTDSTEIVNA